MTKQQFLAKCAENYDNYKADTGDDPNIFYLGISGSKGMGVCAYGMSPDTEIATAAFKFAEFFGRLLGPVPVHGVTHLPPVYPN